MKSFFSGSGLAMRQKAMRSDEYRQKTKNHKNKFLNESLSPNY